MENPEDPRVVDLRSDTITKPTPEMRQAMKDAVVGDDVFKEDPTVNELESVVAEMFGKEAALLVPTGTMGNLASVMAHCNQRGQEILVGDASHIFLNEQGNVAQVGIPGGAIGIDESGPACYAHAGKAFLRISWHQHHMHNTLKQTKNAMLIHAPWPLRPAQVTEFSKQTKIPVHMDGARIMNAATYLDLPVSELLKGCDSVMMCISKVSFTLAPALEQTLHCRVARVRKALGGGMRQVGILAAAGLVALKTILPRLHEDHENTQRLARGQLPSKLSLLFGWDMPG
ncbi:L-allo-threonine aldolase, putative [Ixodes scapularis]|uniref:L-allo-threonine aldolase, putative n=1 Tax=Ixodes scapularis TaxID=6945 RepID=B7QP15_IXOSC|nr:L-allo-threonine aldolase, putative [Ixodes scapularis]|eukprot:XP_002416670.1 L-allo-threonine aldolase, putative [Ixodes scapularis]